MKKILSVILILSLVFALFSLPAIASDKVTIEFCVGDSTLSINGQAVTVEKPYVVGVGVTLVPLRVITEAFGATVEWIGETRSINLTYPDVNIHLQIDNPVAEVNGKAQELLSAPELTNSVTMVPLRFISETFGATVSYDDATAKITVVKEASSSGGSTVVGAVTNKLIGDSYYGWSMENPTAMTMDERYFDGTYTSFSYDDNNYIEISVFVTSEDYNFDSDFASMKEDVSNLTLVKADKDVSDPAKKKIHIQARSKDDTINVIQYVVGDKILYLSGLFENSDAARKDEALRIMNTFDATFGGNDIYDLSTVKNGTRKFESEILALSLEIPADFYESALTVLKENEHTFYNFSSADHVSEISLNVYSKSDVGEAKAMAEHDLSHNKEFYNQFLMTFYPVTSATYNGFKGYQYNYEVKANAYQLSGRDVFFELGDYVYNINVASKVKGQDSAAFIDSVLNSIVANPIDSAKAGTFLRNESESTGTTEITIDNLTFEIPDNYVQLSDGSYSNPITGVYFDGTKIDSPSRMTSQDIKDAMGAVEKEKKAKKGISIFQPTTTTAIHGKNFYKMVTLEEHEGDYFYFEHYACNISGELYLFTAIYPELSYSKGSRAEIEKILYSMEN